MTFKEKRIGITIAQALKLDPGGTLYTFVDHSGEPTHIASRVLYDIAAKRTPVIQCQTSPSLIEALEKGLLGVEPPHALKLPESALDVPGLVCEWGDSHIIADGAHRLWRRWKRGDASFPAYVVPESVWRHFVVLDVPGDGAFWDSFNRTAQVRTPEMELLLKLLTGG